MSFFFNDTATTEIYTLSLHDALPIYSVSASSPRSLISATIASAGPVTRASVQSGRAGSRTPQPRGGGGGGATRLPQARGRSEEHTSELQSRQYLVCRLLLEKKKNYLH